MTTNRKQAEWDQRYAAAELVWGTGPNCFVESALADLAPRGRALDLACGEGRNAIWLAERGWRTTGVDFSGVAIARARRLAAQRGVSVEFLEADVTSWQPEVGAYALVVVAYLQIPPDGRRRAWACVARALAPGGELVAVGHARANLSEGVGGPREPEVLWEPAEIARELREAGLEVCTAEHRRRPVEDSDVEAVDTWVRARKPAPDPG